MQRPASAGDMDGYDAFTSAVLLLEIDESAGLTGGIHLTQTFPINLRAERDGSGTGRVYTIEFTGTDDAGNDDTDTEFVTVPHDQSN